MYPFRNDFWKVRFLDCFQSHRVIVTAHRNPHCPEKIPFVFIDAEIHCLFQFRQVLFHSKRKAQTEQPPLLFRMSRANIYIHCHLL